MEVKKRIEKLTPRTVSRLPGPSKDTSKANSNLSTDSHEIYAGEHVFFARKPRRV